METDELALSLVKRGEAQRAVALIDAASSEIQKTQAVQRTYALALAQLGRIAEAVQSIKSATAHAVVAPQTHGLAAKLLEDDGQFRQAFEHYAILAAAQPAQLAFQRGLWRCAARSEDDSLETQALALSMSASADVATDLGLGVVVCRAILRHVRSASHMDAAVSLAERVFSNYSSDAEAYWLLVNAWAQCHPLTALKRISQLDLERRPFSQESAAYVSAALEVPQLFEDEQARIAWRIRYAKGLNDLSTCDPICSPDVIRGTPFHLAFHNFNAVELQSQRGQWLTNVMRPFATAALVQPGHASDRAIKVGFVSKHLRDCTVGHYFKRFITELNTHTPGQFEVHVFACGIRDHFTDEIESSVDQFTYFPLQGEENFRLEPLRRIANAVVQSELDILVYPEIGMEPLIEKLAAMRLALRQIALWGHPITTGLPTIDAFVSAAAMEPNDAPSHYVERLELISGLGISYTRPPRPETRSRIDLGLPAQGPLLICAQSSFKWSAQFTNVAAQILNQNPTAALVYFVSRNRLAALAFEQYLRSCFQKYGLDMDRVVALPETTHPRFLATLSACDIALDTFDFSGGNTSLDSFSVGLPVVTLPGKYMRGRQTMAMLQRLSLHELVAADEQNYIHITNALLANEIKRSALRQRIESQAAKLFDDVAPLDEFRQLLRSQAQSAVKFSV